MSLLDELVATTEFFEIMKLEQFKGIKVIVDPNLPENRWYVAVSKDIYEALRRHDKRFWRRETVVDILKTALLKLKALKG